MRRFGVLVAAVLVTGSGTADAQPLAELATPGTGIPTVTPVHVVCTDTPVSTPPDESLRILASHSPDLHEQFAAGELVVLNANTTDGIMPGQQFYIRRVQRPYDGGTPYTQQPAAIRTSGGLTVVAADENSAIARIDLACDSPRAGDYLEPYTEPTMAEASGPDGWPIFENPARVLFGRDRRQEAGAGDIVSIDRGSAQGMMAGRRVAVYRDRRNGTPLVEIGEGHVVAADADSARILLTRARDAVRRGDLTYVKGEK
jgi:hypothetical protein